MEKIINMGSAEDLLQYDLRNHIKLLKKDLDISYIRFWNIFTKGMNIDPTVTVNYNFEKIDSILDFLLEEGLKPFIELRYKVRRIHRSTKKAIIFENEDFKFSLNSAEWFDLVSKFMKHVNNRYGKKIVNEWMLEFSFEHYQGKEDLKELIVHYKKTYEIIKKYNSIIKIGGPGAAAQNTDDYNYQEDLIYFQSEQVRFDFISYTIFPYQVGIDGERNAQRIEKEDFLIDTVTNINQIVEDTDYQGAEIIISEWNNTISNRNAINDSLFKGSYLINNFSSILDKIDGVAYWVGSDLFSEFIDSRDILHGGAGLIAKGSLLKPVFHAYRFMNFLNEKIILNSDGVIISYNDESEEYSLIASNYQNPNLEYYMTAEDEIRVDDIQRFFDNTGLKEIQMNFAMEPNKKFELRIFRVNNQFGNIISGWKDIGLRSSLRSGDLEYLQLKADPQIKFKQVSSDISGLLVIEDRLEPNEFVYISVSPIEE
jgi:xylan 1,4-beta-xylosidase